MKCSDTGLSLLALCEVGLSVQWGNITAADQIYIPPEPMRVLLASERYVAKSKKAQGIEKREEVESMGEGIRIWSTILWQITTRE
jgi:hypothetical protein